jgi:hypothetical protein
MIREQNDQIYKAMQLLEETGQLDWQINPDGELRATVVFIKQAGKGQEWAFEKDANGESH